MRRERAGKVLPGNGVALARDVAAATIETSSRDDATGNEEPNTEDEETPRGENLLRAVRASGERVAKEETKRTDGHEQVADECVPAARAFVSTHQTSFPRPALPAVVSRLLSLGRLAQGSIHELGTAKESQNGVTRPRARAGYSTRIEAFAVPV
jgi:hypothetical protein